MKCCLNQLSVFSQVKEKHLPNMQYTGANTNGCFLLQKNSNESL